MASEPSSQFSSAASSDVFYLHDNGQLVLPYVPPAYLDVNASKICDGLFIGNREASQVRRETATFLPILGSSSVCTIAPSDYALDLNRILSS